MWYKDGKVFGSVTAIRNDNKNMSLPMVVNDELIAELGYQQIVVLDTPEYDAVTQYIVELPVDLVSGVPTIGWDILDKFTEFTDDNGTLHTVEDQLARSLKTSVPEYVSMRQARLALHKSGVLVSIDEAIKSSSDEDMKIEWEYASEVRRDWAKLNILAGLLNMSEDDIDNLFILAASL